MTYNCWGLKPKNEQQHEAIKHLLNPDIDLVILEGVAGSGKEQPLSAKISTPNGWVEMGSIKIGDIVNGFNGVAKVIGLYPQGIKPVYKISFSDGRTCEAGLDHLFEVKTQKQLFRSRLKGVEFKKVLSVREMLSTKTPLFVKLCKPVEKIERDFIIPPYSLGVLLGDGCLTCCGLAISSNEPDIIRKVEGELQLSATNNDYNYTWVFDTIKPENRVYKKYLKDNNLLVTGAYKFIPKEYLHSSAEQRRQLLNGLMDTDGYVGIKNRFSYSTISCRLKNDFVELCQSLGYIATVSEDRRVKYSTGVCYHITIQTNDIIFTSDKHMKKYNSNKLKYPNMEFHYKDHIKITSISYVRDEESQCIMLDSHNHLYLTDNYVVTHNTLLSLAAGMEQVFNKNRYSEIIFTRAPIAVGADLGFLPGDIEEKMTPWCRALFDNLEMLVDAPSGNKLQKEGTKLVIQNRVKMYAMMHMRGRSLTNRWVIIDEVQNISIQELKVLLTRAGEGCKIVCMGDVNQIDNKKLNIDNNSLSYLIYKSADTDFIKYVELPTCERSKLAAWAAGVL